MVTHRQRDPPADRAQAAHRALRTYDSAVGNDATRFLIMEAFALGLSKYFGSQQDFESARTAVQTALKHAPKSIHLRAADFALECKLGGKPVPERLVKFIDRDNGSLRGRICPEPFRRFDVGPSGDVLVCCGHWVPHQHRQPDDGGRRAGPQFRQGAGRSVPPCSTAASLATTSNAAR